MAGILTVQLPDNCECGKENWKVLAYKLIISLYPFKSYHWGSVYRAEKMGYEEAALLGAFINQRWPIELPVMSASGSPGPHTVIQQWMQGCNLADFLNHIFT